MAKSIDLVKGMPTFQVLEETKSTMSDAFMVSVQADTAAAKVQGATQGVFAVMRHHVVQIYVGALAKVNGDKSKLDLEAIAGDFLLLCANAEKEYDIPAGFSGRTWTNAKSQLKAAITMGYAFDENREAGQSAIQKWAKSIRDAEKKKEEEAAMEKARERMQKSANDSTAADTDNQKPADTGTNAASTADDPMAGLTDEQKSVMLDTIKKLAELNTKDTKKADNILGSFANTVASSFRKALGKLASVA